MHIIWHGQSCFQVIVSRNKGEQTKLVIDPFSTNIGLRLPRMEANIVLVSHDHHDHNNAKAVAGNPFLIEGPGEYEIKDIFIQGIASFHDQKEGKERGRNTVYTIDAEEMRICHLGDLGQKELTPEQMDRIGDVDVLMIPVGGNYTIDAKGAGSIISQIEPKIVIPMHYRIPKLNVKLEGVDKFLREMGKKTAETLPKLLVKAKDLPREETKIVVLKL